PKNQILLPEDLAAFLPSAMCNDYQRLMRTRFSPFLLPRISSSMSANGTPKIGLFSYRTTYTYNPTRDRQRMHKYAKTAKNMHKRG
ncbi:MAG: hypothetical protein MJY90_03245, partial [Bacteroidaceae bacterium]|nr:hypothetical protein [Bacteroidaceae bacterium]